MELVPVDAGQPGIIAPRRRRLPPDPGGRDRITAHPGDFIFNPARMVHREVTGHEPGELIVMRLGPGPQVVNVEGPDPG